MASSLLNKNGISLLEVTAVLLIIGFILSMALPSYISRINSAKYEKTVNELTAIAQASVDYFKLEGRWPDPAKGISQLAPQFMAHAVTSSPFQTTYNINCVNDMVTAYVVIPAGIAQKNPEGPLLEVINQGNQDKIEVSQTVPNELTSRLSYGLKTE